MTITSFLFGIVAKDDQFKLTQKDFDAVASSRTDITIHTAFVKNNTKSLTKVYNDLLKSAHVNLESHESMYDYVVLMHADVCLDINHLITHIIECDGKYDLMGLCGTEVLKVGHTPLNWFTGSMTTNDKRWGCVTHGELGNQLSFFSKDRESITDHEVACIDGLCIIFSRKAVENGLMFDENLKFNCYDTQISLEALMNRNMTIGVLVEPTLQHYSVGKSILTDDFLEDELVLRTLFNFDFPKGSKIEQLKKTVSQEGA